MAARQAEDRRPSPEEFLRRLAAEERRLSRGRLKVFLGYASGVGKSFRMLDEGRRRRSAGEDVVVAAVAAAGLARGRDLLRDFEVIPPAADLGGARRSTSRRCSGGVPQVVLIDGLAYQNPPGSRHAQRWQDVEELLAAGISVITSVNLQYVKERQAQVEAIRGKKPSGSPSRSRSCAPPTRSRSSMLPPSTA